MKFSKTNERQLREFISKMDANGCVIASDWTSGAGRYTTPKAVPPFVTRFTLDKLTLAKLNREHGEMNAVEEIAWNFFKENKRRKIVYVLDKEALADFLFENARGQEL